MKRINQTTHFCPLPPPTGLPPAEKTAAVEVELKRQSLPPFRSGFLQRSRERWAGVSCCAAKAQFPTCLCYTSANHPTQQSVQPAGASKTSPLTLHLLVLASISGELKSCSMDEIHGGHCSLITAPLHVLLGTDCTARHPPTRHRTSPI